MHLDDKPLGGGQFQGTLRGSQRQLLDAIDLSGSDPLHIVAPPGAGKTLIGLMLAQRLGSRAVVFAPTTTIALQWEVQAHYMSWHPDQVSEDVDVIRDFTVSTYQRVSVTARTDVFQPLARQAWVDELSEGAREDGEAWLDALAVQNPRAYNEGIAKRATRIRKTLARQSAQALAKGLHPNALALVDRLVAAGVQTIILDECHHLLDHWAHVIAYLVARLREAGLSPRLIGLTATTPSVSDIGYENYSALLGEVDYEQPTPTVVQEGNLAPYRELVWFVQPTPEERAFLHLNDTLLAEVIAKTLGRDEGVTFLRTVLIGEAVAPEGIDEAIGAAFARDFDLAVAATRLLRRVAPDDELLLRLPATAPALEDADIRILARFLMDVVYPDASRVADWKRAKALLSDFGYSLSDRGIRRTRDPIDTILASTLAKDQGAADIVAGEMIDGIGADLRAAVVCDFARFGNRRGRRGALAGALRTFSVLVADRRLVAAMPVLVTGKHLRIAARDAATLIPRLAEQTGVVAAMATVADDPAVVELTLTGVNTAVIVAAVTNLLNDGFVRVIVGTRSLLGEGWDCPALNTLIDLTSAATSAATQQLRGRALRLDPERSDKVAHIWTVTTLLPGSQTRSASVDFFRMQRKLDLLWGVSVEGEAVITRGLVTALTSQEQAMAAEVIAGTRTMLDVVPVAARDSRASTLQRWREVAPFVGLTRRELLVPALPHRASLELPGRHNPTFHNVGAMGLGIGSLAVSGVGGASAIWLGPPDLRVVTLGIAAAAAVFGIQQLAKNRSDPPRGGELRRVIDHATLANVVLEALKYAGTVKTGAVTVDRSQARTVVSLADASHDDALVFREALEELYSPIRSPRYVLALGKNEAFVPVPSLIGRRKANAERFAELWQARIGNATLHAITSPDMVVLIVAARRSPAIAVLSGTSRDVWA